jgi:hypothetical protein
MASSARSGAKGGLHDTLLWLSYRIDQRWLLGVRPTCSRKQRTSTMALIRKTRCKRDLGQRQVRICKKLLRASHAALRQIIVRGKAFRLLECAGEVVL